MRTSRQRDIALEAYLRPMLLVLFLSGLVVYAVFQARHLIAGPQIILHEPDESIQQERLLTLRGETNNITSLTLNGREIFTDEQGFFTEQLVLENGYTIMNLHAKNRYGRTIDMTRSYVYMPRSTIN